jgi:hypothetical protein
MGRGCIIGDGCKSEFDAIFDGQPVKLTKEVCGGTVWMVPEDNVGNRILDSSSSVRLELEMPQRIEFHSQGRTEQGQLRLLWQCRQ